MGLSNSSINSPNVSMELLSNINLIDLNKDERKKKKNTFSFANFSCFDGNFNQCADFFEIQV